jgi:hypothetical protein
MKKSVIFLIWLVIPAFHAFAQDTLKHIVVPGRVINGDTIPFIDLGTTVVFPRVDISNTKEVMRFDRLVYNVRIVYPYAKLAAAKLTDFRNKMDSLHSEKEKRRFIRNAQKQLEDQFGDKIREMSFTQGKILIKLIYRETGNSTFDIVKELRGGFNAFIWQTMARVFGYDLHTAYDPSGDDKAIERIVQLIDSGQL